MDESTLHRFGPIIDVLMDRLKVYASRIAPANKMKRGQIEVAFEPLRRQDMIKAVFCSTLSSMKASDRYDTVSTIEFWREIQGGGSRDATDSLLAATEKALLEGVSIERLFLVRGWASAGPARGAPLINEHEALCKRFSNYKLGYYVVFEEKDYLKLREKQHVGVCRIASQGADFVLQPSYSAKESGSGEDLIALNYVLGKDSTDAFAQGIKSLWSSSGNQGRILKSWAEVEAALQVERR